MKSKRKILQIFTAFMAAVMLCPTGITVVASLQQSGSLCFTPGEGAAAADFDDQSGVWTLTDGSYTVTGTAEAFEAVKIKGNVTLTMDNAKINLGTALDYALPAVSIESGDVNLFLSGSNEVQGGLGHAGIYVAEGAKLTISGDGSLLAVGGNGSRVVTLPPNMQSASSTRAYFGGGAGIGGNGLWIYSNDTWLPDSTPSFGTVVIESGDVAAQGGKAEISNAGAGAGIGSGGGSSQNNIDYKISGAININGGTVNAVGGDGENFSLSLGGAGIGSGGVGGNYFTPYRNVISVLISDGSVTAAGTADGAGIGGGANADGGVIEISGGRVNATGGYEIDDGSQYGAYGGAGIGGGDNGGVTSITISGGTVIARAIGAAAGIGSGNDGFVGTVDYDNANAKLYGSISIEGSANVTAIGGSHVNKTHGGAGIGAGRSYYYDNGFGRISITGNAKVRAYAGAKAQAVGVGSYYEGEAPNSFHLGTETIDVWMFNQDTEQGAFWSQNEVGDGLTGDFSSDGANVVWYTMPESEAFPAADIITAAYTTSNTEIYEWKHTQTAVQLVNNDAVVAQENIIAGLTPGNWATVYSIPRITVSYEWVGTEKPHDVSVPDGDTITAGTSYYTEKQTATAENYAFDGWYTDKDCSDKYNDGTVLNEDTVFYGKWTPKTTPVEPKAAAYCVEHYKQQLDGSYQLIETEFPLYGEIGTTVTAQAKAYDHYHVNESAQGAVMFGTVEAPTAGSDGAPQILTLRVCYDLELLTVAYELNGGKGADSVDYGTVTVKYGDSVLVKAAPTREGYTFTGWRVENNIYQSGAAVTVTGSITLTAQWKEIQRPTPTDPDQPANTAKPDDTKPSDTSKPDTDNPQTWDEGNIALGTILLMLAGAALIGMTVYGKKKKYGE